MRNLQQNGVGMEITQGKIILISGAESISGRKSRIFIGFTAQFDVCNATLFELFCAFLIIIKLDIRRICNRKKIIPDKRKALLPTSIA